MRSLVRLSLEPEVRRGHGALYHALAAWRVDDERLFSLLTEVLPPLVAGPEAQAGIAGHDVIDCRMLDRALAPSAVRAVPDGPSGGAPASASLLLSRHDRRLPGRHGRHHGLQAGHDALMGDDGWLDMVTTQGVA